MSIKRALIVDDSKSAQISLKKLLEAHDLAVELADSAEAALEFLKYESVDVIFMDHTMPGMDGLQAVSVIKSNPRTATIPVMMYTSKEGEVYVSQARALGAIDVLPKQVQPGVLFEMLLKLGLVKDRRAGDSPSMPDGPARRATDSPGATEEHVRRAIGISLEGVVRRILEDQHSELRSDMMRSHRDFARSVAAEIIQSQQAQQPLEEAVAAPVSRPRPGVPASWFALLVVLCVILGALLWQIRSERDLALQTINDAAHVEKALTSANGATEDLEARYEALRDAAGLDRTRLIAALEWALNQNSRLPYDALPFDDSRAVQLQELLGHLVLVGFKGTVRMESHLGEFCLVGDDVARFRLAPPEAPIDDCALLGHALDDSTFIAERQSVAFVDFLVSSPLVNEAGIEVVIEAHDRSTSTRLVDFPPDLTSAGEWNAIAESNNRVQYTLTAAASN